MTDRGEPGERSIEQLPGWSPLRVRDEADAACVSVVSRIVEKAVLVAHCARRLSVEGTGGVSRRCL
jgi:hypothetical protein